MRHRPFQITLLGILNLIQSLAFLAIGVIVLGVGASNFFPGLPASISPIIEIVGIVLLAVGAIDLVVTIGIFKGWRTIWYLTLVFAILGLGSSFGLSLANFGVVSVLLDILMIIILILPSSRTFFRIS